MATTRYQVMLPEEIGKYVDKKAKSEGRSKSNTIVFMLNEYLKIQRKNEK